MRLEPYHLVVENLELTCCVGVHAHEHQGPQCLRVDITLRVLPRAAAIEDRLENVVCYEDVVGQLRAVAASQHHALLETLAQRIIAACAQDAAVLAVTLRIRKPGVLPAGGTVGVELFWSREAAP